MKIRTRLGINFCLFFLLFLVLSLFSVFLIFDTDNQVKKLWRLVYSVESAVSEARSLVNDLNTEILAVYAGLRAVDDSETAFIDRLASQFYEALKRLRSYLPEEEKSLNERSRQFATYYVLCKSFIEQAAVGAGGIDRQLVDEMVNEQKRLNGELTLLFNKYEGQIANELASMGSRSERLVSLSMAVFALGSILYLFFSLSISSRISKPIRGLIEAIRKSKGGMIERIALPVGESWPPWRRRRGSTYEEISELYGNFSKMSDELGKYIERLHAEIEERRRAEDNLRRSEEKFRALAENSSDTIMRFDADLRHLYINPAAESQTGLSPADFIGKTHAELGFPEELCRIWEEAIAATFADGKPHRVEFMLPNGGWTDWVLVPELGGDGRVVAVVVSARDITERKRQEETVLRLNEELERSVARRTAQLEAVNKELESFSYSVSHDLRTPLRAIDGFSLALLEDCGAALDDRGRDYLKRVRAASQRMGDLIDDLLKLSKINRGEIRRREMDLGAIARAVAEDLRAAHPERAVEFVIESGLLAKADPDLVRIALENLMMNAFKFTSKHERARIEVGAVETEGERAFFVRDDGAGFDMAYAEKLFKAFQRLHAATDFEGTGIGLATVQRVIQRHGGRVWAEGAVEGGAAFFFTLPTR